MNCSAAVFTQGEGYGNECDNLLINGSCTQFCEEGYVDNNSGLGQTFSCYMNEFEGIALSCSDVNNINGQRNSVVIIFVFLSICAWICVPMLLYTMNKQRKSSGRLDDEMNFGSECVLLMESWWSSISCRVEHSNVNKVIPEPTKLSR